MAADGSLSCRFTFATRTGREACFEVCGATVAQAFAAGRLSYVAPPALPPPPPPQPDAGWSGWLRGAPGFAGTEEGWRT